MGMGLRCYNPMGNYPLTSLYAGLPGAGCGSVLLARKNGWIETRELGSGTGWHVKAARWSWTTTVTNTQRRTE
jgi:hypothetical protein